MNKRNTNFKKDLKTFGQSGELEAADFFKTFGYKIDKPNTDSKYDFIMTKNGVEKKVEVKNDVKCITPSIPTLPTFDTGNIFIEYTSWGRKAGIETTKADLYVYIFGALKPKELWVITVDELKQLIRDNNFVTTKESGDEGSYTEGFLIPKWEYKKHFNLFKFIDNKWVIQK